MIISLGLYLGIVMRQITHYALQSQSNLLISRLEYWSQVLDFESNPISSRTEEILRDGSIEYHAAVLVILDSGRSRFLALDGYRPPEDVLRRIWIALEKRIQSTSQVAFESGNLVVVAVPVPTASNASMIAAVTPVNVGWRHLVDSVIRVALVGLIGSALLSWLLARSISRPVTRLSQAAQRVAQGFYEDPPLPSSDNELGQLSRTFNNMREQVHRASQIQRDFLTGVSHDLKTPLSIIKGYVCALEDGVADDNEMRTRSLAGISKETDRMEDFIAALLELARLEAGLAPFNPRPMDLTVLARKIIKTYAIQAQERNLNFEDLLPPNAPMVALDGRLIERVITNLVDNALKYSGSGGTIKIGGENQVGHFFLWIDDCGPGIPAEDKERLFERFFRGSPAKGENTKGSGLGLTIAKEIMLLHAGNIDVENLPEGGARFTIWLPLSEIPLTKPLHFPD
jgi:signal transduction histidine kinase